MAELAVSAALLSFEIIFPVLNQHLNLKKKVKDEIESFEGWLRAMKAFLEDNEDDTERSRLLEDKVEQVRGIAYDIEDLLEEFSLHSSYIFHSNKFTQKAVQAGHNIKHHFPLHGISGKIKRIKNKIDGIVLQNILFANGSRPAASSSGTRSRVQVSPLLLDDELVGYKKPREELISQLIDGEKRLVRIAVVGPGGSGKSICVKNVFGKRRILGQFDCHAWVHVSQHFDVEELLSDMLKKFCESRKEIYCDQRGGDTLTKLRNYLVAKRYIVVLDNIWRREDWERIKNALPSGFLGSRIILTTRASDVASSAEFIHHLNGLEALEAWTLFCKKAFQDSKGECPSELKDCSVKILKRCEGLPFYNLVVAGALSNTPKFPREWEKFHSSLGAEIERNSPLLVICRPGYKDLSSNLKSCLLYFSIFPEDYSVSRGRLVRLWVAERFATETRAKTAEEVAEDYLNELIQRNLVHVSSWGFDGQPRYCRVLNLVRPFIVQKCEEEKFASIFSEDHSIPGRKPRRISVQSACTYSSQNSDFGGVRSMSLFRCDDTSLSEIENSFRLLRVLDFQGSPLSKFPKPIVQLILLRYLSLRDTEIDVIPQSIKKLLHLETLDLKQTNVTKLPKEIWRLHNLQHLFAYKYKVENYVAFESVQGAKVYEGIETLTKLQKLSLLDVSQTGRIIQELKCLTQLRKLGLTGIKREFGRHLCASIEQMKNLTTLDLCTTSKEEYLELGDLANPPRFLQRLYLKGRLRELPRWISSLDNLFKIGLMSSKLLDSPLKALQNLPNLVELQLVGCYVGDQLLFEASSFQKLKNLVVEELSAVHTVVIEERSIPELQQMSLRKCGNLKMLPLGIHNLGKVKELTLYDMNQGLIASLRKDGQDCDLVVHIPVVHSFTLNGRSWSFENLSPSSTS